MGTSVADLEKLLKLITLGQQVAVEIGNMIRNIRLQDGKTIDELLQHAEVTNEEAKQIIASL